MKEHESRILTVGEKWYEISISGNMIIHGLLEGNALLYVDENNFLHNLNDIAYQAEETFFGYVIHGKEYTKRDWEIEVNRIKMLEELETI